MVRQPKTKLEKSRPPRLLQQLKFNNPGKYWYSPRVPVSPANVDCLEAAKPSSRTAPADPQPKIVSCYTSEVMEADKTDMPGTAFSVETITRSSGIKGLIPQDTLERLIKLVLPSAPHWMAASERLQKELKGIEFEPDLQEWNVVMGNSFCNRSLHRPWTYYSGNYGAIKVVIWKSPL